MAKSRFALLLSLLASVAAYSQSRLDRRVVTVPVEINNIPATFLVDTGAERTVVDSAFARQLGLKLSEAVLLQGDYSTNEGNAVTAKQVRIGRKLWSDVPLATQDLSALSRMLAAPISGVLGTDLLESVIVRISYASGTAQVVAAIPRPASLMPLKKVRKVYFVPVKIGPSTFEMLLDTGTNMTALSSHAWQTLLSSWKPTSLLEGLQSSGGPPGSLIACVPALQLGGIEVKETVLRDHPLRVIMTYRAGIFADPAFAGILGGDILERFEVTLDLQHDSMYLKPDRTFQPDAYEFVTIGIQFFKSSADAFSVEAVWKHSPAEEAGVVVGDRIVAVNGHSAADLDLQAFVDQLHGPAGTPIVIDIERAAGKIVLNLETRQLVCQPGAPR
jgi:predicted aspartyl protease